VRNISRFTRDTRQEKRKRNSTVFGIIFQKAYSPDRKPQEIIEGKGLKQDTPTTVRMHGAHALVRFPSRKMALLFVRYCAIHGEIASISNIP
ncbi:MAG: hypothetical protein D6735_10990, partial [Acidobacteria bacterium]